MTRAATEPTHRIIFHIYREATSIFGKQEVSQGGGGAVGPVHVEQAREKRKLAALIRRYAAGLDEADKRDLLAYAARIETEANRLERGDAIEKA